jgi:hypothetical protein
MSSDSTHKIFRTPWKNLYNQGEKRTNEIWAQAEHDPIDKNIRDDPRTSLAQLTKIRAAGAARQQRQEGQITALLPTREEAPRMSTRSSTAARGMKGGNGLGKQAESNTKAEEGLWSYLNLLSY